MSDTNFSHLVEFNEDTNELIISRVFPNGEKQLFTQTELPSKKMEQDREQFDAFAKMLGENLLVDSPIARKLLGI